MFSRRSGWDLRTNRLAAALEARRRAGDEILDLTISNPTRADLPYPGARIAEALAGNAPHVYDPDPRGALAAREAIASSYARRGIPCEAEQIVLTASTSEAYAWLFKLLCDPGDRVLVPRPSYPLFEFLATLESVETVSYPLRYDARWEIDRAAVGQIVADQEPAAGPLVARTAGATEGPPPLTGPKGAPGDSSEGVARGGAETRTIGGTETHLQVHRGPSRDENSGQTESLSRVRAIVLVSPNNPTGSYVSDEEIDFLAEQARAHGLALISDEVFSSYPLEVEMHDASRRRPPVDDSRAREARTNRAPLPSLLRRSDNPAFVLDGLSKSAGLPGMKIGWIVVSGPDDFRRRALERLEIIADTYLSAGTPVQNALPKLIEIGEEIAGAIRSRTAANLGALRSMIGQDSPLQALRVEGGWSAVLRVPRTRSEEDWCLELLEEDGVLLQPGWFFDFESEAYLVVSLLTPERDLAGGISRIRRRVG